jgi:hypothetical protein
VFLGRVVPIVGTTRRLVECGQSLHRMPDDELFKDLVEDIDRSLGLEGFWYAVVMLSNGQGNCGGLSETTRMPPPEPFQRMVDLAVLVNRESHHNGHWIIGWVNERIVGVWRGRARHRDEDAATVMLIEQTLDEPWARAREWSLNEMAERLEAAYVEGIDRYRQQ